MSESSRNNTPAAVQPPRISPLFPPLFLLLGWLAAATLAGCTQQAGEREITGETQGTTYDIKVVIDGPQVDLATLRDQIEQRFAEIDRRLSNYREDSDISRFNDIQSTDWMPVAPEIVELIDIAKLVSVKTHGCYDLTVKPLFDLWGFSKHENRIPSDAEIDQTLQHVGMDRIRIDRSSNRLKKDDPELRIDLSSIAQGYSVAEVARLLENHAIHNYLIEIGGELRVKGRKANGQPWRVAIEKPTPFERQVQRVLDIHERDGTAIMTAGTYRNFFEQGGQAYSHILDPHTGRPVTHKLLSVTVLHEDPTWADAWDTALLCVGELEAKIIAEREGLKALLIYHDDSGLKESLSSEFLKGEEQRPNSGP